LEKAYPALVVDFGILKKNHYFNVGQGFEGSGRVEAGKRFSKFFLIEK